MKKVVAHVINLRRQWQVGMDGILGLLVASDRYSAAADSDRLVSEADDGTTERNCIPKTPCRAEFSSLWNLRLALFDHKR